LVQAFFVVNCAARVFEASSGTMERSASSDSMGCEVPQGYSVVTSEHWESLRGSDIHKNETKPVNGHKGVFAYHADDCRCGMFGGGCNPDGFIWSCCHSTVKYGICRLAPTVAWTVMLKSSKPAYVVQLLNCAGEVQADLTFSTAQRLTLGRFRRAVPFRTDVNTKLVTVDGRILEGSDDMDLDKVLKVDSCTEEHHDDCILDGSDDIETTFADRAEARKSILLRLMLQREETSFAFNSYQRTSREVDMS